jgi:hypothetical protein
MDFANQLAGRFLGLVLVLSTWPLTSMGFQAVAEQSAPAPGEEYRLTTDELRAVESKAIAGDALSINRLIDYYMLYMGDEVRGVFWLERLGDTGDKEARSAVLRYFQSHPTTGKATHVDELRKRWDIPRE